LNIGIKALSDPPLVEKAIKVMHELQSKYKETVPLGILRNNMGVVIETVPGTYPFRYVLEAGKLFHLHTSAPGKAIMAFLPDEERERLIQNIKYTKFNKRTITSPYKLRKVLKEVRAKGYAVDNAEEVEGMHCVGAPIFNRKGYPIAAVWITGPSIRLKHEDFDDIGVDVRKHADRISKSLGYESKQ
jgi:DNA-binding IclR family transcriptional regulator